MSASVITRDADLPSGFEHPHASEEARELAQRGLILRGQVGSGVHGTAISGQDDRDEMGFPVPAADRDYLRAVRRGDVELGEVLEAVARSERRLVSLMEASHLPDEPDSEWINDWLHRSHVDYWRRREAASTR